jgi:hypothetical protein
MTYLGGQIYCYPGSPSAHSLQHSNGGSLENYQILTVAKNKIIIIIIMIIEYKLLYNMPLSVVVLSIPPNTFDCHVSTLHLI